MTKKNYLLTLVLLMGLTCIASAQPQMPPIPIDPNVRVGVLDNGLTYYIRRNELPENRADFFIAQKVGSVQESEDQKGLAHFLEHMAFNGTTNFPGGDNGVGVIEWCETIGVKFGVNLNAYTSIDETVYNISNVPTLRGGVVDSCLLILHDWANALLLGEKEIDKERGVIEEEWRTRMSPQQRFMEKALSEMYKGTRYADCLPIGSMDIVRNFEYQTLRDYYEKWYRPDLQGIMIVGDVDVDVVEAKIKEMFADIPAQPNAEERIYYPVTDNKEPIIVIEKDKEQTNVQVILFNKHEQTSKESKNQMSYLVEQYAKDQIGSMLNARFEEITQTPNSPFIYAYAYDSDFFVAKTKGAFTGVAICKEDAIESGIEVLLREIERVRRFGFTATEYDRARADYLTALESAFNEKDKVKNVTYAREYVSHFLDNEPIAGIENEYAIMSQVVPNIPIEVINELMKQLVSEDNKVLSLFGPDKESIKYPTKDELLSILNKVKDEELTPYVDQVSSEPLLSEEPKGGKIVSETTDGIFGTTEMTLSNGVKVVIKKTDFKADEIQMYGSSLGGSSLYPDSDALNVNVFEEVIDLGGLGVFSQIELPKVLAGKRVSSSASIGNMTDVVSGYSTPKDFETLMQLTYLRFQEPRKDVEAFESFKSRAKASLKNQALNPKAAYGDSIRVALYDRHPRVISLKEEMIDNIDYDRILEIYSDRFKDASDFTFNFVGNIDIDSVRPYIEKYLGSLPSINRKETFKDNEVYLREGIYKNEFKKELETPKASVFIIYSGKCKFTLKNNLMMSLTTQVLSMIYTEKVREEEGGTYGVGVRGSIEKLPRERFSMSINFDTDPAKKDDLLKIIFAELEKITEANISAEEVEKVKEYMLKSHNEQLKENSYWMSKIKEEQFTGMDMNSDYVETLNSITLTDLRKFAKSLIKQKNRVEVTMTTEVE